MSNNMLRNPIPTPTYPGITLSAGASVGTDDNDNPCFVFTSEGDGAMGMQRVMLEIDTDQFPGGTEVGRTYRVPVEMIELDGGPLQLTVGANEPITLSEVGPVTDHDFTAVSSVTAVRVMHNGSGPILAKFRVGGLFD